MSFKIAGSRKFSFVLLIPSVQMKIMNLVEQWLSWGDNCFVALEYRKSLKAFKFLVISFITMGIMENCFARDAFHKFQGVHLSVFMVSMSHHINISNSNEHFIKSLKAMVLSPTDLVTTCPHTS